MTATQSLHADYLAASGGAALLDRSERGKLALSGDGAKEFLQGQVTQDIERLTPGHGAYAAFLTQKGKMLGDMRVLDSGAELLLDTERSALQELFNMIRRYSIGYQLQIHKRTLECGLLSLIGPLSMQVLTAAGAAVPEEPEHDHLATFVGGIAARVIRTDLGLDLLTDSAQLDGVRAALLAAGAQPITEATAECLRIEHGRPRYGVDLDDTVIPQEAGLNDRAVSFQKGCYVGQETVARLYYRGKPNRELRGLRAADPIPVGTSLTLPGAEQAGDQQPAAGARVLGVVTSAADSPRLGPIALALVRREAPVGTQVRAGSQQAEVVALPFD